MRLAIASIAAVLLAACAHHPAPPPPGPASAEIVDARPELAIVFVIDRSGSMAGQKLDMAKVSVRSAADVLEANDLIGVVAFDSAPVTVVRLQRASNRERVASDLAPLQPGGGTDILPALRQTHEILASVNARVKHVILLSDGQAAYDGVAEACDAMRADGLTVSTVGIGDADQQLLQLIADHGGGRVYATTDLETLPGVFTGEIRLALGR